MFNSKIQNLNHSIELRSIDTNMNLSSKAKPSSKQMLIHKSLSGSKTSTAENKSHQVSESVYYTITDKDLLAKSNSAERHQERNDG